MYWAKWFQKKYIFYIWLTDDYIISNTNKKKSSPACTELEVTMMDWLAKMLMLPTGFLSGGKGGGVIQVKYQEKNKTLIIECRTLLLYNHYTIILIYCCLR